MSSASEWQSLSLDFSMKFSDQNCFSLFSIPSAHTSPYMEVSGEFSFENYDLYTLRSLFILSVHAIFVFV